MDTEDKIILAKRIVNITTELGVAKIVSGAVSTVAPQKHIAGKICVGIAAFSISSIISAQVQTWQNKFIDDAVVKLAKIPRPNLKVVD